MTDNTKEVEGLTVSLQEPITRWMEDFPEDEPFKEEDFIILWSSVVSIVSSIVLMAADVTETSPEGIIQQFGEDVRGYAREMVLELIRNGPPTIN